VRALPTIVVLLAAATCLHAQQPAVSSVPDHVGRAVGELLLKDDARVQWERDVVARQDVERYEIDVCVDPARRRISGECAITVRASVDRLVLALNSSLAVGSVRDGAGDVLGFTRDGETVEVRLRAVPAGPTKVIIRYQGAITAGGDIYAGSGLVYLGAGARWYPASVAQDPATMRIVIRYPDGCSSVCTGTLVGMAPPSTGQRCGGGDVWEADAPLSGAAAVVGTIGSSFGVWGDVFLGYHWYVPALDDSLTGSWRPDVPPGPAGEIKGLVGYLEACYGPYPFKWLNVVLLPPNLQGFDAAASAAGLIVVQDVDGFGLSSGSSALARCSLELARSWWGFSMDSSVLVSEGLSAAAEVSWLEATGGEEEALRRREFRRSQYARALADSGGSAPLSDCIGETPCGDRRVCRGKGSALFDMLQRLVGPDAYCRSLALLAERYRGTTTSLRDLIAVFEETTGQDLDWFFYEWVYRGDLPTYAVEYTVAHVRGGRYRVRGTVKQDGEIYRTPLPLTVDVGTWSYDEIVPIESSEQQFDFVTDIEPLRISVDGDRIIPAIESSERAGMHFERGSAAKAANDWGEAVDEYGAAVFLEPRDASYRYAYGEALVRSGRLTAGLETLDAASRLDPGNAEMRLWLAQLYLRAYGYAAALRHLDAYVGMRKDDPIGHSARAIALVGLKRLEEAQASVSTARALVAQAGSPPAAVEWLYVAAGRYHEAIGDKATAVSDYQRALRANPVSDEARKRLAALAPPIR
jgi:hypothetical protein